MPKKQTFGKNWWAQRWIAVLESFGWASRLQRGRSYARSGHVLDLTITPGKVAARVQGSRAQPYRVSITLAPLSPQDWELATAAMAGQAVYAARLLAGEMPAEIEDAFAAARVPLFPRTGRDLTTACSCPDWANPCKHVAAVYYRLGQEFDADPFLLFRLRGRERESVLADLRARRSAAALGGAAAEAAGPRPDLAAAQDHFWAAVGESSSGPFGAGGRLAGPTPAAVRIRMEPPAVPGALLRRLGAPPGLVDAAAVLTQLTGYYRTISAHALALAMGDDKMLEGESDERQADPG